MLEQGGEGRARRAHMRAGGQTQASRAASARSGAAARTGAARPAARRRRGAWASAPRRRCPARSGARSSPTAAPARPPPPQAPPGAPVRAPAAPRSNTLLNGEIVQLWAGKRVRLGAAAVQVSNNTPGLPGECQAASSRAAAVRHQHGDVVSCRGREEASIGREGGARLARQAAVGQAVGGQPHGAEAACAAAALGGQQALQPLCRHLRRAPGAFAGMRAVAQRRGCGQVHSGRGE